MVETLEHDRVALGEAVELLESRLDDLVQLGVARLVGGSVGRRLDRCLELQVVERGVATRGKETERERPKNREGYDDPTAGSETGSRLVHTAETPTE